MIIKKVIAAIRKTMDEVSTPPNKTSYYWKNSFSLISWIVLNSLYLARCFSLLQWIKYIARKGKQKDDESKRPNVPSYVVEVYYLALSIVFIGVVWWWEYIPPCWDSFIKGAAIYFLAESIIWVLYYFFFRRFFEEKYAIMHTLEYIVTFPFVIILQACCLNLITGLGVTRVTSMLINPDANTPLPILAISVIYTAVILGLIISNLPTENIKEKGDYRYHLLIVGYGEVVKGKLLNAVAKKAEEDENYKNVAIYDFKFVEPVELEDGEKNKKKKRSKMDLHKYEIKPDDQNEIELFRKRILASNILWIATPPLSHLQYVEPYYNRIKMVVVEKPITIYRNELELFRRIHSGDSNIFCLSYYYLEKALPLTFLYSPCAFYEKYLDFNDSNRQNTLSSFERFGKLKSLVLKLFEELDNRESVGKNGGHLFETFLHLAVLARMVIGEDFDFRDPVWNIEDTARHDMSHIHCIGNAIDTSVHFDLEMRKDLKSVEQRERKGTLTFDNGTIDVDFDEQEVIGKSKKGEELFKIRTKQEYKDTKYSIQVDMVMRCFEEGIRPSVIDGSYLQIKTLEWLIAQKTKAEVASASH